MKSDFIRANRGWEFQPDGLSAVGVVRGARTNEDRGGLLCTTIPPPHAMLDDEDQFTAEGRFRPFTPESNVPPVENFDYSPGFFGKSMALIGVLSDWLAHSLLLPKLK